MPQVKSKTLSWRSMPYFLIGDYWVLGLGLLVVMSLVKLYWHTEAATKVVIHQGSAIYGTYSLAQQRTLEIQGPKGISVVEIRMGRVRFLASPCANHYCVHQGWLDHAGQAAICLPNRVSIELQGDQVSYDTLTY
jgi:hypothetical protein